MCLAIPGRIVQIGEDPEQGPRAEVDFDGQLRRVLLLYVPEARVGDYVVVHAGFATTIVPEPEALDAQRIARGI
jgi:hydrogenase expression/formation protein HypC